MGRRVAWGPGDSDLLREVVEEVDARAEVVEAPDVGDVAGAFDCVVVDSADGELLESTLEADVDKTEVIVAGDGAPPSDVVESGFDFFDRDHPSRLLANRIEACLSPGEDEVVLRALVENVPSGVLVVDEDRRVSLANETFVEIWGFDGDAEDVVGVDDRKAIAEAAERVVDSEGWIEMTERVRHEAEGPMRTEFELVDGTLVDRVYVPVYVDGVRRDLWVFRDVTEYRRRERQLEGLHETTRQFIDADEAEDVYAASVDAAEELLEFDAVGFYVPEADVLEPVAHSDSAEDLFDGPPSLPLDSFFGRAFERGKTREVDDVREHDAVYNPETPVAAEVAVPVGDHGVVGAASTEREGLRERDVDFLEILAANARTALDRLVHEREIEEREEWYSALISNSQDVITVVEPDGTIAYQSPSVERVLGYDSDEMVGETTFDYVHPDDRERVVTEFLEALEAGHGHTRETIFRYRDADGEWRWLESIGTNLLDHPVVHGGVINSRDVTERRRKERELERQKQHLEEFASVLSHDIRNPLNVVLGRLELAVETGDVSHVEDAREAAGRMEDIVDDVLELARAGSAVVDTEDVDVGDAARRAWANVPSDGAELRVDSEFEVEADEPRLARLLENLFRNSVEHAGDEVVVCVGSTDDGFYVEDDGEGLPEDSERVFEHGFSTEDGAGLGLAIVEEIAEAHGWSVDAGESPAGGARFEFRT
ncbi:MAG: PAS domain S-box protein [Halobacteriales archaeon]